MGKGARQKKESSRKTYAQDKQEEPSGSIITGRTYPVLAGIFVLGLFLRLFDLARKPLWLDEASTSYLTTQPNIIAVWNAAAGDHHPPLHFITVWMIKFIGSSEFMLRLPSAVAGALTVIVLFFIARELYSDNAGLIAAALLAVSQYHLYYSQEARMYGMVVLFVSLAVYFFLRSVRTGTLSDWLFFGGACALSFYTHFYSAFMVIALVIGYGIIRFHEFWGERKTEEKTAIIMSLPHDFKQFLAGLILAGIIVMPLLGSFIGQSGYFAGQANLKLSALDIPSATFLYFSDFSAIVAILFVCLMLIGIVMLWNRNRMTAVAITCIMFVPVLISMYLASAIPFDVRYHLYLITVFLALVAIPLSWFSEKIHAKYGTMAIVVLVLLLSVVPLYSYYSESFAGQDWRTASETLKGLTKPGDAVVPLPWNNYLPMSYYYNNETYGTHYRNFPLTESGFRELDNERGNVYFVITLTDLNWKGEPAVSSSVMYLDNHTKILYGKSLYDIIIAQKIS